MVNFSRFGRAMHPEFAAQWVFSPEFDPLLETLWDENCGNLAWRLTQLASKGEPDSADHGTARNAGALGMP